MCNYKKVYQDSEKNISDIHLSHSSLCSRDYFFIYFQNKSGSMMFYTVIVIFSSDLIFML